MVPMEYNTNGKGIMAPMKYILIIFSPNWKCMALWRIIFEIGNGYGEREKKYSVKDTMSIKISFMLHLKKTRAMLPVTLDEFGVVYMFFATFFFSL